MASPSSSHFRHTPPHARSVAAGRRASPTAGGARSRTRWTGGPRRGRPAPLPGRGPPRFRGQGASGRDLERTPGRPHGHLCGRGPRRRARLDRGTSRAAEPLGGPAPARPQTPGRDGVGAPAGRAGARKVPATRAHWNQIRRGTCARRPPAPHCADNADHDRRLAHVHALAAPSRGGWGLERLIDLGGSSRGSETGSRGRSPAGLRLFCSPGSETAAAEAGPAARTSLPDQPTRDPPTTSPRSPTE